MLCKHPFDGKIVKVIVFCYEPYTFCGRSQDEYSGPDIKIMKAILDTFNAKPHFFPAGGFEDVVHSVII